MGAETDFMLLMLVPPAGLVGAHLQVRFFKEKERGANKAEELELCAKDFPPPRNDCKMVITTRSYDLSFTSMQSGRNGANSPSMFTMNCGDLHRVILQVVIEIVSLQTILPLCCLGEISTKLNPN